MNNGRSFILLAVLLLLSCCLSSLTIASTKQDSINTRIKILDREYQKVATEFYHNPSNFSSEERKKYLEINALIKAINQVKTPENAIKLIHSNLKTVKSNIDSKDIFTIIELLLDANDWNLANSLFLSIKDDGDKSLLATTQFIFAKFHAKRNNWNDVNTLLTDIYTELSEDNAAYAHLLKGNALQHMKKHREAAKQYKKIQPGSTYYNYAQLNISLTDIRQGWWTDAKSTILDLIKQSKKTNKDELINRLYLILGYALLQREYYRDARDAFRHIGLNSNYTNRALLGIGLTATSQGDYIGALNAITRLKEKDNHDISVDESYLLIPYIYEKLNQELTVTTSYSEAMNYYQIRIDSLKKLLGQNHNILSLDSDLDKKTFTLQKNSFNYGSLAPNSFISNYKQLYKLQKLSKSTIEKNNISKLIEKYNQVSQRIINNLINKRIKHLKSYLNQSRYGLARLYDSSNDTKQ